MREPEPLAYHSTLSSFLHSRPSAANSSASTHRDGSGSLEHARSHCGVFFPFYNDVHRHSGLAMLTPADVHYGRAAERIAARAATMSAPRVDLGCGHR